MTVYLDTQVTVWLGLGSTERLSRSAKELIRQGELRISPAVLLELEYLHEIKRVLLSATEIVLKLESELSLKVCGLGFPQIAATALNEKWTRDPFDRLIVAHAKTNGFAPLVSSDVQIRTHYPRSVW